MVLGRCRGELDMRGRAAAQAAVQKFLQEKYVIAERVPVRRSLLYISLPGSWTGAEWGSLPA